jgi:hypothetical protein
LGKVDPKMQIRIREALVQVFVWLTLGSTCLVISFGHGLYAAVPEAKILDVMSDFLSPLENDKGWRPFLESHRTQFKELSAQESGPHVVVEELTTTIDGEEFKIGLAYNSVFAKVSPKQLVHILNRPQFFQYLYGLDKPAISPIARAVATSGLPTATDALSKNEEINEDIYNARIFKLVPGLETQDYTLSYKGRWDGETWVQRARLVKDEKKFALRDNLKVVEKSGDGSIYREVSLFYPNRWYVRLFPGTLKKVTARELAKVSEVVRCAAEEVSARKLAGGLNEEVASECHRRTYD